MASKYDTTNVKVFDNEVLETAIENQLITKLDLSQFAHSDYSLTESAGMKKAIRTYVGSGKVEELAMGQKNTTHEGVDFKTDHYEVKRYQATYDFYDEQLMNDPTAIEALSVRMATDFVNDLNSKVVEELAKTSYKIYEAVPGFDVVADAIALFPHEGTEDEGLFLLVNRADVAKWRKALKDDLSYVEAFSRTGYIGSVCGVPMYMSDAVKAGDAFIGTREAVTIFVKKGMSIETGRDIETKLNTVVGSKYGLVALQNGDKVIHLTAAKAPEAGE